MAYGDAVDAGDMWRQLQIAAILNLKDSDLLNTWVIKTILRYGEVFYLMLIFTFFFLFFLRLETFVLKMAWQALPLDASCKVTKESDLSRIRLKRV